MIINILYIYILYMTANKKIIIIIIILILIIIYYDYLQNYDYIMIERQIMNYVYVSSFVSLYLNIRS